MSRKLAWPKRTDREEQEGTSDVEEIKEEYHKADVALQQYFEECGVIDIAEKKRSIILLVAVATFVIAVEFALVFYLLGEDFGAADAVYASMTAIVFVFCSSFGAAFFHANTSRNLPTWRRFFGLLGILISVGVFLYGIGILSGWRADTVNVGIGVVLAGYKALFSLPVFITALVNVFGFAVLVYEARKQLWPRFWGYREIHERYDEARKRFESTQSAEV